MVHELYALEICQFKWKDIEWKKIKNIQKLQNKIHIFF